MVEQRLDSRIGLNFKTGFIEPGTKPADFFSNKGKSPEEQQIFGKINTDLAEKPLVLPDQNHSTTAPNVTHEVGLADLLSQEQKAINQAIDKIEDNFDKQVNTLTLAKNLPKEKWISLEKKRVEIHNGGNQIIRQVRDSNPDKEEMANAMVAFLKMAKNLMLIDVMENEMGLAKRSGIAEYYEPLSRALKFKTCNEAHIKIAGLSIKDFLKEGDFKPSGYLKSVVEATTARLDDQSYGKILSENSDNPMMKEYANTTKVTIHNACEQIALFSIITPAIFTEINVPYHSETGRQIISKAREITQQALRLREDLLEVISSPDSPDFPELSETLKGYLDQEDVYIRTQALLKFGLAEPRTEIWMYRMATERRDSHDQHQDFYTGLMRSVEKFTKDYPHEVGIFTVEDVLKFMPGSESGERKIPSFEDLRVINEQILKGSSNHKDLKYEISPTGIGFRGTEVLKGVQAEFISKGDPTKVNIFFHGEKNTLAIGINTKKNEICWNSLDDQNDPKMQKIKNEMISLAHSSLLVLKEKVIEERNRDLQRIAEETKTKQQIISTPKPPKREWIPREKPVEKIKPPKPMSVIEATLQNQTLPVEKKKIREHLEFPKDIKFRDLMATIPHKDRKKVISKIKLFNENGSYKFKAISAKHEGKTIYELVMNGFRVLAVKKDSESGNGQSSFEIFKIDFRSNVFGNTTKSVY